jgi:hypothetical protein
MNVTALQIVGLLILGTAGCVSAHENDSNASQENSGSDIPATYGSRSIRIRV